MAGTTLTYNGVQMANVKTKKFVQTCQYDDSRTDLLYHRFQIRVESFVRASEDGFGVSGVGGSPNAVDNMRALHGLLMHPRGVFSYQVGHTVLLEANSDATSSEQRDVNNGPKPTDCQITRWGSDNVFRIEFEIEICVVLCGASTGYHGFGLPIPKAQVGEVLNNRWSLVETLDQDHYMTRKLSGLMRVAHISVDPTRLKGLVVPPLADGFKREGLEFTTSPDGLSFRYMVRDVQRPYAAPPPATSWGGSYEESLGVSGAMGYGSIDLWLKGGPNVSKQALVVRCAQIFYARLGGLKVSDSLADSDSDVVMQALSIREIFEENRVEIRAKVLRVTDTDTFLNLATQQIGAPLKLPDYNPNQHRIPHVNGEGTPTQRFAAYLQSPCNDDHGLTPPTPGAGGPPANGDRGDKTPESSHKINEIDPDSEGDGSDKPTEQTGKKPYIDAQSESQLNINSGIVAVPIGYTSSFRKEGTQTILYIHPPTYSRTYASEGNRLNDDPDLLSGFNQTAPTGPTEVVGQVKQTNPTPAILPDGKNREHTARSQIITHLTGAPQGDLPAANQPFVKPADRHPVFRSQFPKPGEDLTDEER